ncbi:MAG: hypothetical protein GXY57_02900 [Erysipelotrichaceae bacterium]|jgi:hypothetical protein|nr:hypothetical protein [Bacilli bacterium]NLV29091.1 hypothetical protein [Erysipelotrichaceae bacterium]
MKIDLEGKKLLIYLVPGYHQFNPNDSFAPCALGLTQTSLIIYNDYAPDEIRQDSFLYRVKKEIPLTEIKSVINQKIKHGANVDTFNRLNFIHVMVDDSFFVYYLKKDKKMFKKLLKLLKKAGTRIKKMKISLASNA